MSPTAQHLRLHTSELGSYPAGVSLVGDGSAPVRLKLEVQLRVFEGA